MLYLSITGTLNESRGGPSLPLDNPDNLNLGKPVEFRDDAKLPDELLARPHGVSARLTQRVRIAASIF